MNPVKLSQSRRSQSSPRTWTLSAEQSDTCKNRRICLEDISGAADAEANVYICDSKEFNTEIASQLSANGYNKIYMDEWE